MGVSDRLFISGHNDGVLRIWDLSNSTPIKELKDIHTDAITSVALMPDGNRILTNSMDNTLKIIDIRTNKIINSFEDIFNYTNFANNNKAVVAPSGSHALVPTSSGTIAAFDLESGYVVNTFKNDSLTGLNKKD